MSEDAGEKDALQKNPLGIPSAVFVDDVDSFMKQDENQENAELVLRRLDEQHSKYKFMEVNLLRKKMTLQKQIPEIKTSLDILKLIKSKKESEESLETNFLISDQMYAKAKIPPTDKVCLWLGNETGNVTSLLIMKIEDDQLHAAFTMESEAANVMLEYSLQDADELLRKNFQSASKNLAQLEEDLDFLRDQLTTTEVNMARVYNWDVKRRQAEREKNIASTPA